MPLDLINFDNNRRVLRPGDSGFLISMPKIKWNKHTASEALRLVRAFARLYYAEKCPESIPEPKKEEEEEEKDVNTEEPEANEEKRKPESNKPPEIPIQFVQRDLVISTCGFIASNLANPSDFVYYMMMQLAGEKKDTKIRFPFRFMPVQAVCEARPSAVEKTAMPLIESVFGNDDYPYRFALMYRGNHDSEHLTHNEAKSLVRNCVWAVNPNCVQCIKYQDYAIMIDILPPLFCIGIARDFQRLSGYNLATVRSGLDLTDEGIDSEDDISDDPNLDEEEEKQRKLKIKKKRHAEKAALDQPEGEINRGTDGGDELGQNGAHEADSEMQEAD